ncbi:VTT domain-containing protein [Candidatus Dojkabacteria bacterium]|jgi:uncharacterized membrane protein YdjX (TVP38/TMEM64 family)|nr:VTT domain-containing protein [Candidatus Dojkabacteria bacterium]
MDKRIYKYLGLFLSILLFLTLLILSNTFSQQQITDFILKAGIWAPLLYLLVQIAGQVFAPLSTSVLFVASFVMFGKMAIAYAIIVWIVSSIINFLIARRFGKPVLKFFLGDEGVNKVEDIAKKLNNKHLYLLRILTFFTNDFASYAFGLTNISFVNYMFATILSIIPWTVIMGLVTKGNDTILITTIKVFGIMIPFAIISYLFFKEKKS